ncbi:MAG: helix-turn-helix domain-containing protein [Oscillospiraceae bacterium]|nr:helix-turn-helix domain-containing protein [Oscillospiraceae bacterium]
MDNGTYTLLENLSQHMTAEEVLYAGMKGLVAAEISMWRQKNGMTQKEFGKLMGVSQGAVSRWESGEENFTLETLAKISVRLNIPMQCPLAADQQKPGYTKPAASRSGQNSHTSATRRPTWKNAASSV